MNDLEIGGATILLGDCLELMKRLPDASVDMVLCDLPYGTMQNKWDSVIPLDAIWAAYRRVVKPDGVIVLTSAQPFSSALVMSNPCEFRYQWVWVKSKITGVLNAKRMPVRRHEQVLVFSQGSPTYRAGPCCEEHRDEARRFQRQLRRPLVFGLRSRVDELAS
jgi:site-specific DNA-methyltransferase (adenine-specific)